MTSSLSVVLLLLRFNLGRAVTHYEQPPCQHDEVQGEVLGASGYTCSPRCEDNTFNCPSDMPGGASAQPQCMLQDVDKGAFCGLLCQMDAQCPTGSQCKQMSQMGVGLCLYGASFADWARAATTRKLALGWPNKGGAVANFQVAKTYTALQTLKSKYHIDDGDVDMLTLKELLNSIAPNAAPSPPAPSTAGSGSSGLGFSSFFGGSSASTPAPPPPPVSHGASVFAPWENDLGRLGREVGQGLPGIQSEISQEIYNAEHFFEYGKAYSLFRVVVIFAIIYLAFGSFIKYQSGASGINMIPHIGFWMDYPGLVKDGITYSKMLLDGAMGKGSKSRDFDDLNLSGGLDGSIRGVSLGRGGGAGAFEAL
eukprot:TRINITY_DN43025_c0_g1_i1.p1 TRINITY_DN43025_c0_g1~~TRINITY_DN43025_c0_g1_i1.p1  ORF type:complete len:382 (+),score=65.68 TRINITY_DN43025_c0_g1_i1:49-1146(+)